MESYQRDVPKSRHCNGQHWCCRRASSFIIQILSLVARTTRRHWGIMKLPRRKFLRLAAGAAALPAVSRLAIAQTYVRIV
jgi:hypothetical protein